MLKAAYDALPVKWLETTDSIIEAAEIALCSLSEPATTEQILATFRERGFDIHGNRVQILRKWMSRSGRFLIASRQPTLWQLNPVRKRALRRLSSRANTSSRIHRGEKDVSRPRLRPRTDGSNRRQADRSANSA
jgi:hypothetical protein